MTHDGHPERQSDGVAFSHRPDQLERRLRERSAWTLGPAPRAELLHVLMLPDFERADRVGEFCTYPDDVTERLHDFITSRAPELLAKVR